MDLLALLIPRREIVIPIDHTDLEPINIRDFMQDQLKDYTILGLAAQLEKDMFGLNNDLLDTIPYSTRVFKGIPAIEGGFANIYINPDFLHFEHQPCGWEHYQEPVVEPDSYQAILMHLTDKSLWNEYDCQRNALDQRVDGVLSVLDILNELYFRGLL